MITNLIINLIFLVIGSVFSFLQPITTLPTINGFDIDAAMVQGMGYFHTFAAAFWPLEYMFQGFLVLMLYYSVKMTLRIFLANRTQGSH